MCDLIALAGYARSGKDTVGQILADDYGYRTVSFAQAIKNIAAEINPVLQTGPHKGVYAPLASAFTLYPDWDTVKEQVPAAREFLQKLGVACRDQIGEDVWVTALANSLQEGQRYVVTDCRFPNEAAWVRSQGGQVWRVVRPGNAPVNGHSSETALPEDPDFYDRIIHNDGTLQDLQATVLAAFNGGFHA